MDKRRVLLVGTPKAGTGSVTSSLGEFVTDVRTVAQVDQALAVYDHDKPTPSLVLVALDGEPGKAFDTVAQLHERGAKTLVLGDSKDAELILQALRSGATEYVVASDAQDLKRAVRTLMDADAGRSSGRVVTVFPTKGGVGATAIATNLAGALARGGERVCLLDLDLHFGDVLSFLDLPGKYSVADVISNMSRLDRELLDSSITRHSSGVYVLAQSEKLEEAERIRPLDVEQLIVFLRRHYDTVVVDGLRGFDDYALSVLDASQLVFLTLTQDVPAVRNAQRCVELFHKLGYEDGRVRILLNRYTKQSKVSTDVVAEVTGMPVAATLRNDFGSLIRAVNRGALLHDEAPRSKLTLDIDELAPLVHGKPRAQRRSWLFG